MADLSLLILTLFWGTTFTLVKVAMEITSPGVFLAARFGVAGLVLGAVVLWRRDRIGSQFWRHGAVLGLLMLAGFLLQTHGLRFTTPARSGFLTGLSVLVVPFVARFALGRKVRSSAWAGVVLAVVGLVLLTRPWDGQVGSDTRLGDLLTAGCAVAYALQIVFMSEWAPHHPLAAFTLLQVSVVFGGSLLLVPLEGARLDTGRAATLAGVVLFTGVCMTAVAFFIMNWAQRHTTAVRAALIYSLEPVTAAFFSWLWIGERLDAGAWAGGALIVLGVAAGELSGLLENRAAGIPS